MGPITLGMSSLAPSARRYFIGTAMTPCLRYVSGVLLKVAGRGLNADFEVIHQLNVRTPPDVRALLEEGVVGVAGGVQLPGMASRLVAELQVVNVERMLNASGISAERVTALGQRGPVCGREYWQQTGSAISIGDPAILAEATGLTVIDHFEQRDIAKGGSAHGLDVLPLWLLLTRAVDSHSARPTVVVRLDQMLDLFYLPARRKNRPIPALGWRNGGPGFWLLEHWQCAPRTTGEMPPESRDLAAAMRDALDELEEDAELPHAPSQWKPWADSVAQAMPQLLDSSPVLNDAIEQFWAARIEAQIRKHFPENPEPAEVIVLGRGARRERLVQRMTNAFPNILVSTELTRSWISGASGAGVAAVLAAMHVDQVCGNLPDQTGATAARVLGRITPGTPANWRMVLGQMEVASRQTMPLREAV